VGLVTACLFAGCPTSRSPFSVKATMDGVVRAPSAFSITLAFLPSITATHELVVPRSMPITSLANLEPDDANERRKNSWGPFVASKAARALVRCGGNGRGNGTGGRSD